VEQGNSPEHVHKTVREEFTQWIGKRRLMSSVTLKRGDAPEHTTYIWTFVGAQGMEEHLVVEMQKRMFVRWIVLYGDVTNIVSKILGSDQGTQKSLTLPKVAGLDGC
jgi:hypothetical protein